MNIDQSHEIIRTTGAMDLGEKSHPETIARVMNAMAVLEAAIKEAAQFLKGKIIEWIEANGDLELPTGPNGEIERYYLGEKKTLKCVRIDDTAKAIMDKTGGDWDALINSLVSQPFKFGTVRDLLGDAVFEKFFVERIEAEIKTGKPKKQLNKINPKFLPRKSKEKQCRKR